VSASAFAATETVMQGKERKTNRWEKGIGNGRRDHVNSK
jgi:hypothetical protein